MKKTTRKKLTIAIPITVITVVLLSAVIFIISTPPDDISTPPDDLRLPLYLSPEMNAARHAGPGSPIYHVQSIQILRGGTLIDTVTYPSLDSHIPQGYGVGEEITLIRTFDDGYRESCTFTITMSMYKTWGTTYFAPGFTSVENWSVY